MNIGGVLTRCDIFLAPMAGVSEKVFRSICVEYGAGLTTTEMISAKGICYNNENTKSLYDIPQTERPAAIQLFGHEPESLSEAIKRLTYDEPMFDIIDFNIGCPAPKIVRNGDGSALMANPKLVERIISAMVNASRIPITVKIRKGFQGSNNAVTIARIAESCGASGVTVHGRTREQQYSGLADWLVVSEVKRALTIPVIGNGDITSPERVKSALYESGADGVMIGRAAHGNPWIFRRSTDFLMTNVIPPEPTALERLAVFRQHFEGLIKQNGEHSAVMQIRGHFGHYARGFVGASEARTRVCKAETYKQVDDIAERLFLGHSCYANHA